MPSFSVDLRSYFQRQIKLFSFPRYFWKGTHTFSKHNTLYKSRKKVWFFVGHKGHAIFSFFSFVRVFSWPPSVFVKRLSCVSISFKRDRRFATEKEKENLFNGISVTHSLLCKSNSTSSNMHWNDFFLPLPPFLPYLAPIKFLLACDLKGKSYNE